MTTPALRLHDYPASGNCYKVRLLLALLDRAWERVPVDIFAGETLTDAFGALNPARSTPVLEVGDRRLVESGAILWYLAAGTRFLPDDELQRAEVLRWLLYEQADVIPAIAGLRFRLLTGRLATASEEAQRRRAAGAEVLTLLEGVLDGHPYLVGEGLTIGDIAVYGYVHLAGEAGFELADHPAVAAWADRVAAEPGYIEDVEPYPDNARPGAGTSIYD
jgi:glutathione S-transferase